MVGGGRAGRPARARSPGVMTAPDLVNLSSLIDDAKCYALVRQRRWPEGVRCPACGGATVIRHGRDDTQGQRQRYRCKRQLSQFPSEASCNQEETGGLEQGLDDEAGTVVA